ncbi:hypothetical protein LXL04_003925 [Taraxacum kok-saghyz]
MPFIMFICRHVTTLGTTPWNRLIPQFHRSHMGLSVYPSPFTATPTSYGFLSENNSDHVRHVQDEYLQDITSTHHTPSSSKKRLAFLFHHKIPPQMLNTIKAAFLFSSVTGFHAPATGSCCQNQTDEPSWSPPPLSPFFAVTGREEVNVCRVKKCVCFLEDKRGLQSHSPVILSLKSDHLRSFIPTPARLPTAPTTPDMPRRHRRYRRQPPTSRLRRCISRASPVADFEVHTTSDSLFAAAHTTTRSDAATLPPRRRRRRRYLHFPRRKQATDISNNEQPKPRKAC